MRAAFKEWAVICRAFARRASADPNCAREALSKKGVSFVPTVPSFSLFPTYSHQSPDSVVAQARPWLLELDDEQPEAGTVAFQHYAVVTDALRVRSLEAVVGLRGQHIWSDDVVEGTIHRWRDAIHALIVRVYELPRKVTLELREEYTGCKSWVELEEDVSTDGAAAVIGDDEFARRTGILRRAVGGTMMIASSP